MSHVYVTVQNFCQTYSCLTYCIFLCSAYDLMLSDAMNDLQEQVKVEHVPAEKNEAGQAVSSIYTVMI